jgi:hypothetical protein
LHSQCLETIFSLNMRLGDPGLAAFRILYLSLHSKPLLQCRSCELL